MSVQDIVELAVGFISPGEDAAAVRKWRTAMSLFIFILTIHMLWSCGYFKLAGLPGFATSDEIAAITVTLKQHGDHLDLIAEQALERSLIDTREAQCRSGQRPGEKSFFTQRIADLEGQYSTAMKHRFDLPDCKDLE